MFLHDFDNSVRAQQQVVDDEAASEKERQRERERERERMSEGEVRMRVSC